ncbi:sodium/proline symporter PutP [Agrococcus casei]|uniref:sodium/proline symporter PutP n=3 Tax=Agrococcus casei TaxID=343512 RepID=UPI003F92F82E
MPDQILNFIAIAVYFAGMLVIGYYAYRKTKGHSDYMIAGRSLPPWVAALSAGASDSSGWIMMGLPGALYVTGLLEAWICIGLAVGLYVNWKLIAPKLRAYTEVSKDSITLPSFFENRTRDKSRLLRIFSGAIILVFFTLYISSGMVAGGVFFEESFGSSYIIGMLIVTGITLLYTMFGGFLGASLTDVVQGIMMIVALIAVPIAAVFAVGGPGEFVTKLTELEPDHLSLVGGGLTGATVLTIASGLAWGLGYFGQPHILVRFMALRTVADAKPARHIGVGWTVILMIGTMISGLAGVVYFAEAGVEVGNPEAIVLMLSQALLNPFVAGLILAAVLAAIMSTVSSQMIVCSSALVEDLFKVVQKNPPSSKRLLLYGRLGVLVVSVIAGALAVSPNDTILGLVGFAWAGFGAAFGPIVLLSLFWNKLTNWGALAGMITGAVTVFVWAAFDTGLYELLPAFILATIVAWVVSLVTYKRNAEVEAEFTETGTIMVQGKSGAEPVKG